MTGALCLRRVLQCVWQVSQDWKKMICQSLLMFCVLCGEHIHPQNHYEYINMNTKTLEDTHMLQWKALGCRETGKTWATPANPHSQTSLAPKCKTLIRPILFCTDKRGQSHFCVKLGNYRQVCSLSSRPTNDTLSTRDRPQPGSLPCCVSRVCSCEICQCVSTCECSEDYNVCYTCKVSVCDSQGCNNIQFVVIKVTGFIRDL